MFLSRFFEDVGVLLVERSSLFKQSIIAVLAGIGHPLLVLRLTGKSSTVTLTSEALAGDNPPPYPGNRYHGDSLLMNGTL
jgi:hypothetical protein